MRPRRRNLLLLLAAVAGALLSAILLLRLDRHVPSAIGDPLTQAQLPPGIVALTTDGWRTCQGVHLRISQEGGGAPVDVVLTTDHCRYADGARLGHVDSSLGDEAKLAGWYRSFGVLSAAASRLCGSEPRRNTPAELAPAAQNGLPDGKGLHLVGWGPEPGFLSRWIARFLPKFWRLVTGGDILRASRLMRWKESPPSSPVEWWAMGVGPVQGDSGAPFYDDNRRVVGVLKKLGSGYPPAGGLVTLSPVAAAWLKSASLPACP
jgi:hypothetical protein